MEENKNITLEELAKRVEAGEEISPQVFFDYMKSRKNLMTSEKLEEIHENCLHFIKKYHATGQTKGLAKLMFLLKRMENEQAVLDKGINQFVYQEDIDEYIRTICEKAERQPVKMIELSRYEREVPDEVVEKLLRVKEHFDDFFVIFTDYTGKVEKQIAKDKIEKDPILFGVFRNKDLRVVNERFYYIGDWIDEYCDLTLDRMVGDFKRVSGKQITNLIPQYSDIKVIEKELNSTSIKNTRNVRFATQRRSSPSLLQRIFGGIR